ncbi:MAG: hypothetical protein ARM1_0179 [Candidatus Micrarchaeota archaeon]|nr:MAG: hypothetical protein ARM1_0179 [Candidatus Micrarchaeota archaeon]
MIRYLYIALIMLLLLADNASSIYVKMIEPYQHTFYINNSSFNLTKVGPGQSFVVVINSSSNINNTLYNYVWTQLIVKDYPEGWKVQNSATDAKLLQAEIIASPNATPGRYKITLEATNIGNFFHTGNFTFNLYVNVSNNVFNITTDKTLYYTYPNYTINIPIKISNLGVSDTPFYISSNLSNSYNETYIVLHNSSKTVNYTIRLAKPGIYKVNLTVGAINSNNIKKSFNVKVLVYQTFGYDMNITSDSYFITPYTAIAPYSIIYTLYYIYHILLKLT